MPNLRSVAGVTGGNSRELRVRNFLNRMPDRAVRLALAVEREEGGELVLLDWPRAGVNEDLAPVIMQALQDYLLDAEESEATATLAFYDENENVCASMLIKERTRDIAQQNMTGPLTSTTKSDQILQQMNQNERMHRLNIQQAATLQANQLAFVDRVCQQNDTLVSALAERDERLREKEAELDAMAQIVREQAAETAQAAVSDGGKDAVERGIETLMRLLPLLQGRPQLPPAAPQSAPEHPE